ncbi:hypothetical protein NP493_188g06020 [Ridgeia piscesae]|uniref:Uncharacterized protein n=1 Tax=Ridgeia piscesae TaxID=27915 RepID=A0AAD9P284_RIDPI|nr:hypothetical protein NP493_188g06020 [Ridgeia piscesae]
MCWVKEGAAQKLNITSRKKKKHHPAEPEPPPFPTNFGGVIQLNPPPAPPCLLRPNTRLQNPVLCKLTFLRLCQVAHDGVRQSQVHLEEFRWEPLETLALISRLDC